MRKIRDLFKKIRDTKGIFHENMGTKKDRNGMELTEAEDIKKKWQEQTEELYKKGLNDLDKHDGVVRSLIQSQTFLSVKTSGAQETLLQTKLVEVMKFQLGYLNPKR